MIFNLDEIEVSAGVSIADALTRLYALYAEVDEAAAAVYQRYQLPCAQGCNACCHEAVFITPLEWWGMVDYLQRQHPQHLLQKALHKARAIYRQHQERIAAVSNPPPAGERDHWQVVKEWQYECPFLGEHCLVYPARGLLARLFGASFERPGVVYGCRLTEQALAGQTVTLLQAQTYIKRQAELPLCHARHVIPYYLVQTYGTSRQPLKKGEQNMEM